MNADPPRLVVFSTLFPHPGQPQAGVFIRERMFRVARHLPLTVVAPVPWFPLQGLIRRWRPYFRPPAPRREIQDGIEVYHPRFLSFPGVLKCLDGALLALGALPTLWRLRRAQGFDIIDAHFAYPDGYAATLLGRWLHRPVSITLRGTETRSARSPCLRRRMRRAFKSAARLFAVSEALRQQALVLGVAADRISTVGNAVDSDKFRPIDRQEARAALGLEPDAKVLISVGGLVERKGFHRVIEVMTPLLRDEPRLHYLIVGGAGAEGDWSGRLHQLVAALGLQERVHFLGAVAHAQLHRVLSAADVFVLATSNEGWANVFLEAMACGLPVVTTRVGGNAEVVVEPATGLLVPFGDAAALAAALRAALARDWDRAAIINYARANDWEQRVTVLCAAFAEMQSREGWP